MGGPGVLDNEHGVDPVEDLVVGRIGARGGEEVEGEAVGVPGALLQGAQPSEGRGVGDDDPDLMAALKEGVDGVPREVVLGPKDGGGVGLFGGTGGGVGGVGVTEGVVLT